MKKITTLIGAAALLSGAAALAQDCFPNTIERTTLPEQFLENGDGTVTDAKTGLMWMRCSLGQSYSSGGCDGAASTFSWSGALVSTRNFNTGGGYAGHADWRVPNIKELGSLVEAQCHSPAIDLSVFPDTPAGTYWSSTPDPRADRIARSIYFVDGSDLTPDVSTQRYVRLVRNTGGM